MKNESFCNEIVIGKIFDTCSEVSIIREADFEQHESLREFATFKATTCIKNYWRQLLEKC